MPLKESELIGQLLLQKGLITLESLERALSEQERSGGLLGSGQYADGVRVVEYEYNGDGIRISKTVDGDKTIFINDVRTPLTQVLMECTGNWYIKKRYVYGRDLISQEE